MKLGTTDISKLFIGTTPVNKVMLGLTTIWEAFVLVTGNKWLMTSNTTPSPFVITGNNYWADGSDLSELFKGFDDTTGTGEDLFFSQNTVNRWAYAWIDIVEAVKPKTFYVYALDFYGGTWGFEIHGSNDATNWTLLTSNLSRTTTFNGSIEVSSDNTYRYYRIGVALLSGTISKIRLYNFLLQQWYE